MDRPQAILFDVDGLLITTGGAGTRSWRWAFNELYGIPADIGKFTEAGMTDPVVGRLTFTSVIGREPSPVELTRVISHYLMRLPEEVASSSGYKVLAGVDDTPKDIAAAHAAHAIGVGVASGHYSEEELREAGADYVLGSLLEDLPGVAEPVS